MAARKGTIVQLVIGSVLTAVFGIPFVILVLMVISSAVGPASQDPHGYTMIFGTIFALILLIPLLVGVGLLVTGIVNYRHDARMRTISDSNRYPGADRD